MHLLGIRTWIQAHKQCWNLGHLENHRIWSRAVGTNKKDIAMFSEENYVPPPPHPPQPTKWVRK